MGVKSYFVPAGRGRTEFTERKSRFITTIALVKTAEEAEAFLEEIRAEFPDATHNCAAYRIRDPLVERFFDDGEPGGTAGMPMLDVLKKQELFDVAVVVTRYFGGILLGAGGLVRAYSRGAADGVTEVGTAMMEMGTKLQIRCAYSLYDRLQRMPQLERAEILDTSFGADVCLEVMLRSSEVDPLRKALADLSAGTATLMVMDERFHPFKTIC